MVHSEAYLRQLQHNQATRDAWDRCADHRSRIARIVTEAAQDDRRGDRRGRLCVLGAGNCNDLDLRAWIHQFEQVHLVDLDATAIQEGVARQGLIGHTGLITHAPLDVTGILDRLPSDLARLPDEAFQELLRSLRTVMTCPGGDGPFDVVVSAGLLSQILDPVVSTRPFGQQAFELMVGLRRQHLELLSQWTRDGGTCVLISDMVSSLTVPALDLVDESELPALMRHLIAERNFFTGANPAVILDDIRKHPRLSAAHESYMEPWRWPVSPHRTYLVWGVALRCP